MTRKDQHTVGKYAARLNRELARQSLREIFDFIEHGIPEKWQQEPEKEVQKVQKAFKNILESTFRVEKPSQQSIRVFTRCLNSKVKVEPYTDTAEKLIVGQPSQTKPIVFYNFATDYYFKRLAERLKRCLSEFRFEIFVKSITFDTGLIGLCANCNCRKLFFKKRSNQVCCSRGCINQFDYLKRKAMKPKYYREKSNKSYHSAGVKRKRKRRAKRKDKAGA